MMEFYASFFMVSTLVFQFLWLRERSKRKYAELDRTLEVLYWRNEEARVAEKFLELEAEYNELLDKHQVIEKQSEGEWVRNGQTSEYICSSCGAIAPVDCLKENFYKSNFCPHCGAKMKGGE